MALIAYVYLSLILSFFPYTAPVGDQIFQYISRPSVDIFNHVLGYIPNLIYLILIVFAVKYSLKLLRFIFDAVGRGDLVFGRFEPEWADPTYKLLRALAVVFALMTAYPYLPGSGSKFFQGFSVFVGAIVTLGSTGAIGNLVSGVILTYAGAFRIGDRVRIGEAVGDVLARTLFVTRLRTRKNEEITIPNSIVLGGHVVNFSNAAKRRELVLSIEVGLGYDVHWSEVERLLKEAASKTPGILDAPEPYVWPKALGDFAVVYELHAHTDRADMMGPTLSALRRSVLDALHDAGVEIMTPSVRSLRDASRIAVPAANARTDSDARRGIRVDLSE